MSSIEPTQADNRSVQLDPRAADAKYRSFPSFNEWASRVVVDTVRWDRYSAILGERRNSSTETLRKAREIVKRAAALDTGAIEGLYDVDRGFTFTIATEAGLWEAALAAKGNNATALFKSQLHAYDFVLDLATQLVPIAEAWIRELHRQICQSQETYSAYTEVGLQNLPLPLGEYKRLPNHVIKADGQVHAYSPVDLTPAEMFRFCQELRTDAFLGAHPVLQASYAHYAFVCIHPFADGNGRVSRALASIFTYRSHSIPLMVLAENRGQYISALERADNGEFQPFLDFVSERALDGIRLVDESVRAADMPSAADAIETIRSLYRTSGGYSHEQVDQAGIKLLDLFKAEIQKQTDQLPAKNLLHPSIAEGAQGKKISKTSNRRPLKAAKGLRLQMRTDVPAQAEAHFWYELEVPKDCGQDDDLVLANNESSDFFEARMSELTPAPSAALQMRLSVFVERLIAELLDRLAKTAAAKYQALGYKSDSEEGRPA